MRKTDRDRFIVTVLWMRGWPAAKIAAWYKLTPGKVRGWTTRLPYPKRSELSQDERQQILDDLKADRCDDGLLADRDFVAEVLEQDQVKKVRRVDFTGGERRSVEVSYGDREQGSAGHDAASKGLAGISDEALPIGGNGWKPHDHGAPQEQPGRDDRGLALEVTSERGSPVTRARNNAAAPLEWLEYRHILRDSASRGTTEAQRTWLEEAEGRRAEIARRLRDVFEGAQISPARAIDWMQAPGGSTGGRPVADYILDCQRELARLHTFVPAHLMALLERLLRHDEWVWEGQKKRHVVYDEIRKALDFASVMYGRVSIGELEWRWPEPYGQEVYRRMRGAMHTGKVAAKPNDHQP